MHEPSAPPPGWGGLGEGGTSRDEFGLLGARFTVNICGKRFGQRAVKNLVGLLAGSLVLSLVISMF
eukprot:SAG31_NODE_12142_length_964_cov_1.971098_1_plen_65_part_10